MQRRGSNRSGRMSILSKGDGFGTAKSDSFNFDQLVLLSNMNRLKQQANMEERKLSLKSNTSNSISPSPKRGSINVSQMQDSVGSSSDSRLPNEKTPYDVSSSNKGADSNKMTPTSQLEMQKTTEVLCTDFST